MSKPEEKTNLPATRGNTLPANREAALAALADETTNDEFGAGDRLVPWLKIVQGTSDIKKRTHESYVQGAEVGMIYDTLSRQLRDEAIIAVIKFDGQHFAEFKPNGGDIVKQWFKDRSRYDASEWKNPEKPVGKKITPDGNEIAPSAMFYILVLDPETGYAEPMIWSLGGTNEKVAKRVNSLAKQPLVINGKAKVPAMFSRTFRVTTKLTTGGDAGNEWGVWQVEPFGLITDHPEFGQGWLELAKVVRQEADAGHLQPNEPMGAEEEETGDQLAEQSARDYDSERSASQRTRRSGPVTDINPDQVPV